MFLESKFHGFALFIFLLLFCIVLFKLKKKKKWNAAQATLGDVKKYFVAMIFRLKIFIVAHVCL